MHDKSEQADVEELRGTRAVRLPHGREADDPVIVTALYQRFGTLIDELRAIHPGGPGAITVGVGKLEVTGLVKLSLLDQDVLTESSVCQRDDRAAAELARRFEEADILEIPGLKPDSVAVVITPELVHERLVAGSRGELAIGAWTTGYRSLRDGTSAAAAVEELPVRTPARHDRPGVPVVGLAVALLAALAAVANGSLTLFGVLSSAPDAVQRATGIAAVFGFGVAIALTGVWVYRRLHPCRFTRRVDFDREMAVMTQRLDVQDERLDAAGV